ncbi:MAG: hypothetical protein ACRELB_27615 [Polyangiaceae bacterium]
MTRALAALLTACVCTLLACNSRAILHPAPAATPPEAPPRISIEIAERSDVPLDEGHQPWMADDWTVASVAVHDELGIEGDPFAGDIATGSRVVLAGQDASGRSFEVIERALLRPVLGIYRPRARVRLVRQPHGAWNATRIDIAPR